MPLLVWSFVIAGEIGAGVGLLVGSLTLFTDTLCHSIADNALGITSMLSLDKDQKTMLKKLGFDKIQDFVSQP